MVTFGQLEVGDRLYTEEGVSVGIVHDIDSEGIVVLPELDDDGDGERVRPAAGRQGFGEAELAWRCAQCGEMGSIGDLPEACPNCGAEREELYYWIED